MKKTIYAIAALALVLTGCAKQFNETFVPGDVVTVRAQVNDTYTKVAADNAGTFSWQADDKITLLNDKNSPFEFTTSTGMSDAPFTCTTFEGSLSTEAFYPASASHASGKFFLEPEFAWKNGETNMPMIGTVNTETKSVSFKTAGAAIKLVCYNVADDACKLVVSSDTKKLSGLFTPDGSHAIATTNKGTSDNTITITFEAGHPSTMVFYIPVPTGNLGKLSFVMKNGSDAEVSASQETKGNIEMALKHIVAAPALNCGNGEILWSEDFSQYETDNVPNGKQYKAGSDISYSCSNGTGSGTTKIYEQDTAGGTSPELLVCKNSGTFTVSNIPCDGVDYMTLSFTKNNNAISVTATSGITVEGATSGTGTKTLSLTNTGGLDKFDLTITGPSGNSNPRVDDFLLIASAKISDAPIITPNPSSITIAVAAGNTNTGSTTFTYDNALDSNPVVAVLPDGVSWLKSAEVIGSGPYTLTVTAEKNATGSNRAATIKLRATGVTKDITVNQPNALVGNPSVSVDNEDQAFTATWPDVTNGTSFLAYFGETDNLETNPTSLTALTPSYDNGTSKWSVTKSGLTNGNTYYLYVKTDGVTSNYVSPSAYVKYVVNPAAPVSSTEVTLTISNYATANSWANGTQYSTINIDSNITATADGGGNTGKYYTSGTNWRFYQNESATLTISAKSGYIIEKVTVTYTNSNGGVLTNATSNVTSGTSVNVNATSIKVGVGNTGSAANGQVRVSEIYVKYHAS